MSACTMDSCARPMKARGLCETHYMRARRHGDPNISLIDRAHAATCSVPGCERPYRAAGLCFMHWQRKRAAGAVGPAAPLVVSSYGPDARCNVPGCERRPQRKWLCEMHADRLEATGSVGGPAAMKRPVGSGYVRPDGYVELSLRDHPLARDGRALLHRVVLYEAIGTGPHPCHWCARQVDWSYGLDGDALVVDHLDHDATNNDRSNLVPSCHPCNSARTR